MRRIQPESVRKDLACVNVKSNLQDAIVTGNYARNSGFL